jgi:hypothetical protein
MDCNIFLQKNKVEYTYNRYLIGFDTKEVEYLTVDVKTPLLSDPWLDIGNYSRDGGNSFK